ncbi:Outer membrane protein assembly factor BamD [Planctomycetales bacterium 10988]|nr:Outer membrane protein assembly factor BamD [Planctomycetales bacterium 10988]
MILDFFAEQTNHHPRQHVAELNALLGKHVRIHSDYRQLLDALGSQTRTFCMPGRTQNLINCGCLLLLVSSLTLGCQSAFLRSPSPSGETSEQEIQDALEGTSSWQRAYRNATNQLPNQEVAREALEEGNAYFEAKEYNKAISPYKTAALRWPNSGIEEDALFKLGECYFFTDRYSKAIPQYNILLKRYENSRYLDQVGQRLFLIGQYWEKSDKKHNHWSLVPNFLDKTRPLFDTRGESVRTYEAIRLHDPTGPLADDSVMATATSYYEQGRYRDAAFYYEQLRKDYPRSEHQPKAHELAVASQLSSYQGPYYDGKDLSSAKKLIQSSITQFPVELGDSKQGLLQDQERVRQALARRDFQQAEYYFGRGDYQSARFYWSEVLKNHPDTEAAVEARARLDQTKGYPAQANEPLKWVAKPFEFLEKK